YIHRTRVHQKQLYQPNSAKNTNAHFCSTLILASNSFSQSVLDSRIPIFHPKPKKLAASNPPVPSEQTYASKRTQHPHHDPSSASSSVIPKLDSLATSIRTTHLPHRPYPHDRNSIYKFHILPKCPTSP